MVTNRPYDTHRTSDPFFAGFRHAYRVALFAYAALIDLQNSNFRASEKTSCAPRAIVVLCSTLFVLTEGWLARSPFVAAYVLGLFLFLGHHQGVMVIWTWSGRSCFAWTQSSEVYR